MLSASVAPHDTAGPFTPVPIADSQSGSGIAKVPVEHSLSELLRAEEDYIGTLCLIDEQITPLWSEKPGAADFTNLLNLAREILHVNKRFQTKLGQISARQYTVREISDELMQWTNDLEIPYTNYCKAFIRDLNQRFDIAGNPSIQSVLEELSKTRPCKITLESLFNAPIKHLQFYKSIYTRIMKGLEPGQNNYQLLLAAMDKVDLIIPKGAASLSMPEKTPPVSAKSQARSVPQDTNGMDLAVFQQQINCSQVKDIFTDQPMDFSLRRMAPRERIAIRNDFVLMASDGVGSSTRVHVVLTPEMLIVCKGETETNATGQTYYLMYPPLAVSEIKVQAVMIERELVGDYIVKFTIMEKKELTMRADSKEQRNTWLGLEPSTPSSAGLVPKALSLVAKQKAPLPPLDTERFAIQAKKRSLIRRNDVFSFYADHTGEVSPLESSSDESEGDKASSFSSRGNSEEKRTPSSEASDTMRPSRSDLEGNLDSSRKTLPPVPITVAPEKTLPVMPPPPPQKVETTIKPLPSLAVVPQTAASDPDADAHPAINISFLDNDDLDMRLTLTPSRSWNDPTASSTSARPLEGPVVTMPSRSNPTRSGTQSLPRMSSAKHHNLHPFATISQDPRYAPQRPASPQHVPVQYRGHSSTPPLHPHPPPHRPLSEAPQNGHPRSSQGAIRQRRSLSPMTRSSAKQDPANAAQPHPGFFRSSQLSSYSYEELGSPPRSPNLQQSQPNGIREVIYSNAQCEVFHWKNESWYAVDGKCLIEVRQTHTNRSCISIRLQPSGQLYLNAWILPRTVMNMTAEVDVSITVTIDRREETYLVHCAHPAEANALMHCLARMQKESVAIHQASRQSSMAPGADPAMARSSSMNTQSNDPIPQTLKPTMQCKCKLFVQNEHSNWSSFGNVTMKISTQLPSKKMHIEVENEKSGKTTKLVSASVLSNNVERINPKRISFLLVNEQERSSMVYMVQLREEETGNKIYEYLKTKNAENGW